MELEKILELHNMNKNSLAQGIGKSEGYVSMLLSGRVGASMTTVDAILAWLSERLGRRVTYEEVFSVSEPAPEPQEAPTGEAA